MCNAWNHPSWCRCGFGGEGHLGGGRQPAHSSLFDYGKTQRWSTDEFCISRTCPKCTKNPVWFIRHNGGSFWVENLGSPWTKHPCFNTTEQGEDPFQLLLFDPPAENPLLAIVVQATLDPSNMHLYMEIQFETGEMASVECCVTSPVVNLEGTLIFVYRKSHQIRLAPLGTLRATRLQFATPESTPKVRQVPRSPPIETSDQDKPSEVEVPTTPPRNRLSWTEEQLAAYERRIAEAAKKATTSIVDVSQANKTAKSLALQAIHKLPRILRNLMLHRFEAAKWRQVTR